MNYELTKLFGRSGGKAGSGRAAKEDPDTLQSKAYASMVDLLGEGPYEGFCTEGNVTIFDANLESEPPVVNGAFAYNTTDYVKDIDEVWTRKITDIPTGASIPLVNQDNQGYPFHLTRPIKALIYDITDSHPTKGKEADIRVVTYPTTEAEKTAYLAQSRFSDIATAYPSEWAAFSANLKVYPEGKVRGIYIKSGGEGYVANSHRVVIPRATGSAVLFDGVPSLDPVDLTPRFQDIGIQYRYGYEDQPVMSGFDNVSVVYDLSTSVEIKYSETWGAAGQPPWTWQTDSEVDYDRILIDINLINGLYYQDLVLGDVKAIDEPPLKIYMTHERGRVDESGAVVWEDAGVLGRGLYEIRGKTMSQYEKSIEVELRKPNDIDKFFWKVKIWRRTIDDVDLRAQNGDNKNYSSAFKVSRITAISDQQFIYPFSAMVGIRVNAEQFNRIPVRSYRMKLLRMLVPDNYFPPYSVKIVRDSLGNEISRAVRQVAEYCRDAATGEGVYDENGSPIDQEWHGQFYTAWTNNPVWVAYNACVNKRWGMGKAVPPPNKWLHYKIGRYCDEYGPFNGPDGPIEQRFSCNAYFQTKEEAFKVLTDLASVFAGYYYYGGGSVVPVQDAPRPVRFVFAPANVKDGIFNYKGTQRKVRHTVAIISYSEPRLGFKQTPVLIEDPDGITRYGYQPLEKAAFGCTSAGQARRWGKRLLRAELSNTDSVSFSTGILGSVLRPGDVFAVADPTRSSIPFGGRIVAIQVTPVSEGGDGLPWIVTDREVSDSALVRAAQVSNINQVNPAEFSAIFTRAVGELDFNSIESSDQLDEFIKNQVTDPIQLLDFEIDARGRRMFKLRSALPEDVVVGTMWSLQHTNVKPQYFATLGVEENSKHEFTVTGIEYHEQIYAEIFGEGNYWEDPVNPDLDYWKRPGPPRNLTLRLVTKRDQGTIAYTLAVSWTRPEYGWAKEYQVYLKKNLGNFQYVTTTKDTHVDLPLDEPDSYTIRVFAVGITNILSEPAEANIGYLTGENEEIISGLEITGQANDHTFVFADLSIDWRVNWSGVDSQLQTGYPPVIPATIDAYILRLYDPNNTLLREYDLGQTDWKLTLNENKSLPDGPHRDMIVEVKARTNDLALSVPTRIRVVNDYPAIMTAPDITVTTNELAQFMIHFNRDVQRDFAGFRVWASLTSGFTPDDSNLIWEGYATQTPGFFLPGTTDPDVVYFRVAEFDLLSKDSLDCNISAEMSVNVVKDVGTGSGSGATLSVFDFIWS